MIFVKTSSRNRYYTTGYAQWLKLVKLKHGYRCAKCKKFSKSIHAHHISNYHKDKANRINVYNGITLCRRCHINFHVRYGYYNNNWNQLEEFISG